MSNVFESESLNNKFFGSTLRGTAPQYFDVVSCDAIPRDPLSQTFDVKPKVPPPALAAPQPSKPYQRVPPPARPEVYTKLKQTSPGFYKVKRVYARDGQLLSTLPPRAPAHMRLNDKNFVSTQKYWARYYSKERRGVRVATHDRNALVPTNGPAPKVVGEIVEDFM